MVEIRGNPVETSAVLVMKAALLLCLFLQGCSTIQKLENSPIEYRVLFESVEKNDLVSFKDGIGKKGIDLNSFTSDKGSLLHYAIALDRKAMADLLLSCGADPNNHYSPVAGHVDPIVPPIILAVRIKNASMVKLLIQYKANVNIWGYSGDAGGDSALLNAAKKDDLTIVRILLDAKADPNLGTKSLSPVNKPTLPLHVACENLNLEMAKALLDSGADIKRMNYYDDTPVNLAIMGFYEKYGKKKGREEAYSKMMSLVEFLLEKGGDRNPKNKDGLNAVILAKKYNDPELLARISLGNDVPGRIDDGIRNR